MRVCLDIQPAVTQRAGVGRYAHLLARHLGSLAGADEICLFYFDFMRRGAPFQAANARWRPVRWCPGRVAQKAWQALGWPPFDVFSGKADVFHFPNFVLPPLRSGRSVVTIHDLSFLRHPDCAEPRNQRYLSGMMRNTVERADAIITDSHFSAAEIQELLSPRPGQVHPIHPGVAKDFQPPDPDTIERDLAGLGIDRPYLLTVGTLEPRKNLPFLVDVFERLNGFDGKLVVAGMPGWKYEPILARMRQSSRARDIVRLGCVDDAVLPSLYAGASVFIFASLYEGFGFPPLEAMACGTPVVSSPSGSLREALGDAAIMMEEFDPQAWADRISGLMTDSTLRSAMVERGRRHVSRYTWEETARKTWEIYRRVFEQAEK